LARLRSSTPETYTIFEALNVRMHLVSYSDHPTLREWFKPSISDHSRGIHVTTKKRLAIP
jgi:hypothetical protein